MTPPLWQKVKRNLKASWWKWKRRVKSEVKVKSLSHVQLFATLWTVAYQASLSMGFSRQEYWSGLPFPSPGDLPDPGIEPRSSALEADALTSEPPGKPGEKVGEWKTWLKSQHSENEDHGIWSHHFMGNRCWNSGNSVRLYFWWLQNHCRGWLQPWN